MQHTHEAAREYIVRMQPACGARAPRACAAGTGAQPASSLACQTLTAGVRACWGARAGQNDRMIDSLFTGKVLGHESDIADGSLRGYEFRSLANIVGDYYVSPRFLDAVAVRAKAQELGSRVRKLLSRLSCVGVACWVQTASKGWPDGLPWCS